MKKTQISKPGKETKIGAQSIILEGGKIRNRNEQKLRQTASPEDTELSYVHAGI